jgi:hypothetical protein
MLAHPRVSLMVMAAQADSPQSRARVTIQGDATPLPPDADAYASARACYLSRFPDAEHIFELGDFTLFRIAPVRLRVVGGFGQAFPGCQRLRARCPEFRSLRRRIELHMRLVR